MRWCGYVKQLERGASFKGRKKGGGKGKEGKKGGWYEKKRREKRKVEGRKNET